MPPRTPRTPRTPKAKTTRIGGRRTTGRKASTSSKTKKTPTTRRTHAARTMPPSAASPKTPRATDRGQKGLSSVDDFDRAMALLEFDPLADSLSSDAYSTSQTLENLITLLTDQKTNAENMLQTLKSSSQRSKSSRANLDDICNKLRVLQDRYETRSQISATIMDIRSEAGSWDSESAYSASSFLPSQALQELEAKLREAHDERAEAMAAQERAAANREREEEHLRQQEHMEELLEQKNNEIEEMRRTHDTVVKKQTDALRGTVSQLKSLMSRIRELESLLVEKDRMIASQRREIDKLGGTVQTEPS